MKSKIKFKKVLKAVLSVVLLFGLTSFSAHAQEKEKGKPWHAPESAVKVKNPSTVNDEYIAEGKTLYAKQCKSCHGSSGKGDGPKAANLDISCGDFTSEEFAKQTDGEIYWKTTEGRDPMPSFKKKISDDERWQIIAYIRTLGEKKK